MKKQDNWLTSKQLLQFLESRYCEISYDDKNNKYVNVYNPKTEKVITIQDGVSIPPFQVTWVLKELEL